MKFPFTFLLIGILLLSSFLPASTSTLSQTDWQKLNLQGKVKTLTETTYDRRRGPEGSTNITSFNKEGMIEKIVYINSDKNPVITRFYHYGDDGLLDSINFYDHLFNREARLFHYVQDSNGLLIEETEVNTETRLPKERSSYTYNENGLKIKEVVKSFERESKMVMTTEYDEKNHVKTTITKDSEVGWLGNVRNKYDESGNLMQTDQLDENAIIIYSYQFGYDDLGNETFQSSLNESGDIETRVQFEYAYDHFNNWTLKTKVRNRPPQDKTERVIEYWP